MRVETVGMLLFLLALPLPLQVLALLLLSVVFGRKLAFPDRFICKNVKAMGGVIDGGKRKVQQFLHIWHIFERTCQK